MKGSIQFLRTTVIGGLLFLVPIVVLAVVLKNAFILAHKVVEPLAANLHIDLGLHTPRLLAIALMKCLKRIGAGSNPLLGGLPIEAASPKPH
jgi:uncharacterized membrane protein